MNRVNLTFKLVTISILSIVLQGCGNDTPKEKPHTQKPTTIPHTGHKEKNSSHATTPKKSNQTQQATPPLHTADTAANNDEGVSVSDGNLSYHFTTFKKNQITLEEKTKPIVILTIIDPKAAPSQAQAYILASLQKHYPSFVTAIAVIPQERVAPVDINDFKQMQQTPHLFVAAGEDAVQLTHHIANTLDLSSPLHLPLTLLIHQQKPYRIYESAVPMEMLEHDIQMLLRKKEHP